MRARLAAEVERLRPLARDVAWVAPDNVHLTLKFLGGVDETRLPAIVAGLTAAAAGQRTFDLVLHGLGAFPTPARARVVWAGVAAGARALEALAARVEEALAPLGVPRETRPFAGHVTLGRARAPRTNPRLAAALDAARALGGQGVARVSLMRSDLSPRGARYRELAAAALEVEPSG